MIVCLHTFPILYSKALATAERLLDKGEAFAAERGIAEAEWLGWRLIEDMKPFAFQLSVVANFARQWPARAAGLPLPPDVAEDLAVAGLREAIAAGKAELAALTPAMFEGRDEAPIEFLIGGTMPMTLPAGRWLSGFATTNLYFHLSTAYGILRSRGVPLGKTDLFAGGL